MTLRFLCCFLLFAPLATWAAPVRGIDSYARGDYEKAISSLRQEVENAALSDKDRARARTYLAASLYARGLMDEAREQLEELARRHPEQRVDSARFPPDFVALADLAQKTVETERLREQARAEEAEQRRLLAEQAQARDAERQRLLAEERARPAQASPSSSSAKAPSSFRFRPELVGFSDIGGVLVSGAEAGRPSLGLGAGVTLGVGGWEVGARFLPAPESRWGLSVEAGYAFGRGSLQPRVALRGTGVRGVGVGGGAVVGLRLTPVSRFTLLADVGAERFRIPEGAPYRALVVTASVGVGFNLF
ncbi:tetratricopeptide repeat protein [Melittangium boletus]|uniref:Tetratricopeptide repeat protein n=1 Tax=Melittangium boletus DSM 14713 TaxID=1294270 RepID=A0A250IIP1_9BACT|nr:tetratricopeptide repeat protein [Melittangium boletus]ATB31042.1 hypothetical protein MEBOL_004504 [Melittangium boletus DSM 14713]